METLGPKPAGPSLVAAVVPRSIQAIVMKISSKLLGVAGSILVLLLAENWLNNRSTQQIELHAAHYRQLIIPLSASMGRLAHETERLFTLPSRPQDAAGTFNQFRQYLQQYRRLVQQGAGLHADDHDQWQRLALDLQRIDESLVVYESTWSHLRPGGDGAPDLTPRQADLLHQVVITRLRPATLQYGADLPAVLETELRLMKAQANRHMATQNVLTLVLCSIVLLYAFSLARSIIRPLRELVRTTHAIAAGDRTLRITHQARDELGSLAAAINRMLDSLRASTVSVQELESVVHERTEQLKTANARLDFLLSASPATVFATRPEPPFATTFISVNQSKMLGFTPEEFIASPELWESLIHPEDRERVLNESLEVLAQGYYRHDYRFRHKAGDWRWLRSERRIVHDAHGHPREIIGCVTDVTAEKLAMAKEGEYRLRLDLALSATGICTWDNDVTRKRLTLDHHWAEMLGTPAVETITTDRALLSIVHPDDRAGTLKVVRQIQNPSANHYQIEQRVRRADGQWLWIVSRGRVISRDQAGRPTRIVGTNADITTLKQAELALVESRAQLALALQSAGLGVWHWDIATDRWMLDEQARHMLGLATQAGPPTTDKLLQQVHPDDRSIIREAVARTLEKDAGYEAGYRVVLPDGEIRHLIDRGRLKRGKSGRPLGIYGVTRDVTTARTAEQILREAAQNLTKMFMAAPTAMSLSELDTGRFIDVNERFVELTQRPRRGLIGHSWTDLSLWQNPADQARVKARIQRDGRVDYEEVVMVTPGGKPLEVGLSLAVVDVDQRRCVLTSLVDLTARNQAIASLRDREKLISSINANLSGTWLYRMTYGPDGSMAFTYVSPNIERIMGIKASVLLDDSARLLTLMHPEDLPVLKRVLEHERNTGGATSITLRVHHPDGRLCWMQFRSQLAERRTNGSQLRDGIVTDVTASKVAQLKLAAVGERLELALRSSRTCTWSNDIRAGQVTLDPAWMVMIGGEPREIVTNVRRIVALVHPKDRTVARAAIRRIVRDRADEFAAELRIKTLRGDWIWMRSLGRVSERDRRGRPMRVVGTNTDITSLKLAEARVSQQAEFLASLHKTTLDLLAKRNLPGLFSAVVERASDLFGAPLAVILLREGDTLAVQASTIDLQLDSAQDTSRRGAPLCWQAIDEGRIVNVPDYGSWPPERKIPAEADMQSVIILPIVLVGERLGVLYLARREPGRPFTTEEAARAEMLANKAALILHNAHAREEAIREAELRTADLRLSEERFRSIFDHSPFAIMISSLPEARFVDLNQAATRLLRMERDQIVGRKSRDVGHWVNESERWQYLSRLHNDGRVGAMEARFRTRDGEVFTGLVSGSVIQLNGEPHVLSVLLDISQQKQADLARAHSLAMLQATLEATADGILAVTSEGRIEAYNRTFTEMWRFPESLLESRDNAKLLAAGLPQLVDPDSFAPLRRHLEEHPLESSSDLMQLKDGRVLERFSQPMLVNGQPTGRVWSYRDITKRLHAENALRESEERFRGVFDHSPIAIALFSMPEGRCLQFNQAMAHTFQYSDEELRSHTSPELHLWVDAAERKRYLDQLERDHLVLDFEALLQRKNGSQFTALINGSLINIGGQPFSLNSIQDISARKAAETKLAESLRVKELLLREIHHRVKNNLQIISSLLHFQAKKAATDQEKSLFRDGQNRLQAMILVHEKLYRSKDLNQVNLADYVRSLLDQLQHTFHEQGPRFELRTTLDNIPATVETALPCGMIVTELVTNAFKYAFPSHNEGLVHVSLQRTPAGFSLTISDNGRGLPAGLDPQTSSSFGLQLVSHLTEQLDARLTWQRDHGTEFTLDVPFAHENP